MGIALVILLEASSEFFFSEMGITNYVKKLVEMGITRL
jgi:hypothetical protein